MVRKVLLVVAWFWTTPILLVLMLVNLHLTHIINPAQLTQDTESISPIAADADSLSRIAASQQTSQVLSASIVAADARPLLLEQFLKQYNSPLAPFANTIVQEADTNAIDYRLVVSIAMCESGLGKHMPSSNSYNAWGIAVYTGQQSGATFKDWPTAIAWVSKYIKDKYADRGMSSIKQMSETWAPPNVETGYSWANCVESFLNEIQ